MRSITLWGVYGWRPKWIFDTSSLREMSRFGLPLLGSGLLDAVFSNIYSIVIPKLFSTSALGLFSRATSLQRLPSRNLTQAVGKVSFPAFAEVQHDAQRLRRGIQQSIVALAFIVFPVVCGMTAVADNLVEVLLTKKWLGCVLYLRLLCVSELLYPLQVINLNVLKARGRSDLFLKLEIIKRALVIVGIFVGYRWGVSGLIISQTVVSLIAYYLNSYYTSKVAKYSIWEQLSDVLPYLVVASIMGALVFVSGYLPIESRLLILSIQILVGVVFYIGTTVVLHCKPALKMLEAVMAMVTRICRSESIRQ